MRKGFLRLFSAFAIFAPVLLYFRERSFIAYDEGFYALQARWILEDNNWIAPQWWGAPVFDRTIATQALIAVSQKIFGESIFSAHLPSLISAIFVLFATYKLHQILLGNNLPWASPMILASTYLWIDYAHLATQDMPLLALEMLALLSILNRRKSRDLWDFLLGLSIGLAIFIKTFMVLIPLISLAPLIIFYEQDIIRRRSLWLGIGLGILPFLLWSTASIYSYGFKTYTTLFYKVLGLSKVNTFSNPFYYYLWNVPINCFPWSLFTLLGVISSIKNSTLYQKMLLIFYPLNILILLSIFETKTPYYALQVTPILAINANIGLQYLAREKSLWSSISRKIFSLIIPFLLILLTLLYLIKYHQNIEISTSDIKLILGVIFMIVLPLSLINFTRNKYRIFILMLLAPYLSACLLVQSGKLTDRNPALRRELDQQEISSILDSNVVNIFYREHGTEYHSKLIKLSLLTPNLGSNLSSLESLIEGEYAWVPSKLKDELGSGFSVVQSSKNLDPWMLIKRE